MKEGLSCSFGIQLGAIKAKTDKFDYRKTIPPSSTPKARFLGGTVVRNPPANAGDTRDWVQSLGGKSSKEVTFTYTPISKV